MFSFVEYPLSAEICVFGGNFPNIDFICSICGINSNTSVGFCVSDDDTIIPL